MFKKYIQTIKENREIRDDNQIYQNTVFLKEIADISLICVGFRNKNLSSLEQGSLIAGEKEFLNRFKNFKNFLGNPDFKVSPIKGDISISSFIKRDKIFLKKQMTSLERRLLVLNQDNNLNNQDEISKKEIENELKYLNSKIKLVNDSLLNIKQLISLLNINFAKMKKLRKKKTLLNKILNKNKDYEKQRENMKNILIKDLNIILNDFKKNIKFTNFETYVAKMAKLKIIESSMGH